MRNDIRVVVGFHRHLKFRKLHKALGADGVLSLLILWMYAAENRASGILHGLDERDIAEAAEWEGSPRKFVRTLVSLGLLDEMSDGNLKIHDWEHHQPWIFHADERSEKARTSARARWGPASIKENTDAKRMRGASGTHKVRNAPSPTPTPTPAVDAPAASPDPAALPAVAEPDLEGSRPPASSSAPESHGAATAEDQLSSLTATATAEASSKGNSGNGSYERFLSGLTPKKKRAFQYARKMQGCGGWKEGDVAAHLLGAKFASDELGGAKRFIFTEAGL